MGNEKLWIIESKASVPSSNQDATRKAKERVYIARRDLKRRLNEENTQLWFNAIKSVRASINSSSEKQTVVNILERTSNTVVSSDKNVLLAAIVFCSFDSKVSCDEIAKLYRRINQFNTFSNIQILVIQKPTFEKIIDYLESLV